MRWRPHSTASAGATVCFAGRLLLAAAVVVCAVTARADDVNMRLRISWGGGRANVWSGTIGLSEGTLAEPRPLGIEADEPGSMWLEDGQVIIRERSSRSYDGLDVLVIAPREAELQVHLVPFGGDKPAETIAIPLADLDRGYRAGDYYSGKLAGEGNRLFVHRSPGDILRVELDTDRLVFSADEKPAVQLKVAPHLLPVPGDAKVRIKIALAPARKDEELWSVEHTVRGDSPLAVVQSVRLPEREGVYDVVVTADYTPGLRLPQMGPLLPQPGRVSLGLKREVAAQRRVQLVVLGSDRPDVPVATTVGLEQIAEIDPAHPTWWDRVARPPRLPQLKKLWKGPLGNGQSHAVDHPLGKLVALGPGQDGSDPPWEAYTLPIEEPGRPHVLEVDYPSDVPQTLGISIIEPNAAGAVLPVGLDSGVDVAEDVLGVGRPSQIRRHRIVFWPRTRSPMVLMTGRRPGAEALFGKIRVLAGWEHLPKALPGPSDGGARLLAAYMDRPLVPENFSAAETSGAMSELGVDDWVTFYQAGTRLVEYLNHVGYGGLMLSVLADGSTVYPSRRLEPTPRYDSGLFADAGQDPVRKDVLEMLLCLFDREGLVLVPAVEFSSPLPRLEAELRRGGPEAEGIRWVGPDGATLLQRQAPTQGKAPYYNPLHPRVQEEMLAVVRELVGRYGHHRSFGGLAIQLSAHGYAQLPGPSWGMDDGTTARFAREAKIALAESGADRFARRAQVLTGEYQQAWLEWRARELGRFYAQLRAELPADRGDVRLYLAGAGALDGEDVQHQLRPALPQRLTVSEALLRVGIDVRQYGEDGGIVLLRPRRVLPTASLARQAVHLELEQASDFDRSFRDLPVPGSLFFHPPQPLRLPSFDQKSPFQPTYTWLATESVPSGRENRQRFVHSLATLDAQVMFDGGWQLPLGQEDSIGDLVAAYRRLPAVPFRTLTEPSGKSLEPVTVRHVAHGGSTYVYLVNDASFPSTVQMLANTPPGTAMEELSGRRPVSPPGTSAESGPGWTVELEPYDLVAVRFSSPNVRLSHPRVLWPQGVRDALQDRVAELSDRAAALRNPPLLDVLDNPGFETEAASPGEIASWEVAAPPEVTVAVDDRHAHEGSRSLRMAGSGPAAAVVSRTFDPPATGRLTISVWLRMGDGARQPPLRVSLVGTHNGRPMVRFAQAGQPAGPGPADLKIRSEWEPFVVLVSDLPLEGLSPLQLRFDLMGPGEVWIDDVQLCELAFTKKERVELFKMIAPADLKLQRGEIGDCLDLLEGYWSRFLMANVPAAAMPVTSKPPSAGETAETTETPQKPERSAGLWERMRDLVPPRLRF